MGKVLWHITMSLDGFVTGPGGDMSWMAGYEGPNPAVDEVMSRIGAVLIGHRTYFGPDGQGPSDEGRVYGGAWTGPQLVYTRDAPDDPDPDYIFVDDLAEAVATAKAAAGDGYAVLIGAAIARDCLDAGLLDEVLIHVVPTLLGDGTRLFDRPGGDGTRLEQLSVTHTPACTNIWLRVPR
ncbi:deaminase [Catellatospora methionotrophica]|uniref:Deaminase n=1 Tax=Catellatospora methionotrophica TaxID=121620 RepID=A0A8J3LL03_9ACTN|nr:dihydrofolate reductase family protein [Catellatospora methionotrophica]GIG16480.1 deaminase [Catellatospora methionotrophica]